MLRLLDSGSVHENYSSREIEQYFDLKVQGHDYVFVMAFKAN